MHRIRFEERCICTVEFNLARRKADAGRMERKKGWFNHQPGNQLIGVVEVVGPVRCSRHRQYAHGGPKSRQLEKF